MDEYIVGESALVMARTAKLLCRFDSQDDDGNAIAGGIPQINGRAGRCFRVKGESNVAQLRGRHRQLDEQLEFDVR
ncbi:hypothetical protein [Rhizobium sp. CCGE531]|uniref:hypothetical protein n=1 Tax=Rhizobium sp. CCGE531 TaxID=2364271 RepID=UPI0013C4AAD2|nr:hypothetical protein [Rhizobium sp. CCGE531]